MSEQVPDYAPGGSSYRRLMIALPAAGLAAFAPLYSPHGLLPVLSRAFDVTEPTAALAISAGTFGVMLAALPWAIQADKWGRPRAIKAGLVLAATLGWASLLAPDLPVLLVIRLVQGMCASAVPALLIGYLSEQVDRRYTVLAAATYVSGNTVGGMLGRVIGAPIGVWFGWQVGVGAVNLIATVATIVVCLALPPPHAQVAALGTVRDTLRLVAMHLRDRALVAVYAQGFLLFGGFIALYNYLAYRLEGPPFGLSPALTSLLFLAYLAGTVTSRLSGGWCLTWGRRQVLVGGAVVYLSGVLLTLIDNVWAIMAGLLVLTGGFFTSQAVANGWSGARPREGTVQSTALYNMGYYSGAAIIGWALGFPYRLFGWTGLVVFVAALIVLAQLLVLTARDLREE